jgi:ABC-type cobalamin/Fe3+-siderophores transport system ATPase subunit
VGLFFVGFLKRAIWREGEGDMIYNIENLSFSYGEHQIIDNLDVDIEAGHFYGILGPNGCGKTTLLDLLVKHLSPNSGEIHFRNKSLNSYSKKEIAKEVALVAQNYSINFPYQVNEVVMMGRHPYIGRFSSPAHADYDLVDIVMEKSDILQFKDRLITELSGGERQRVVFARALAQTTPVLILDEATANLDINHTLSLLDLVKRDIENNGKTVISVFQDINLAALYCDRLIFMKKGKVFAAGTVDEVLERSVIKDVFDIDSKIYFDDFSNSRQVVFKSEVIH